MTKYIIVTFDEQQAFVYDTNVTRLNDEQGHQTIEYWEHNTMFFDSFREANIYAQKNIKNKRITIVRLNYIGGTYENIN